jgi:hypothetical protein
VVEIFSAGFVLSASPSCLAPDVISGINDNRVSAYNRMTRANALHWLRASYVQLTHSGVKRASIQSEARGGA